MWDAWRQDAVTSQWSASDIAYARDTIERFERNAPANELRLRMDGLGLTPKGKRDLRWRTGTVVPKAQKPKLAGVRRLRAIGPAG